MLTHCSLQIISQGQTKAENITSDVGMQIKQLLLVELAALLRRWVCLQHLRSPWPSLHLGWGIQAKSVLPFLRQVQRSVLCPCPNPGNCSFQ
jgi:hypothetical protein